MLNLILTSLLQVGEAANPGNYPNNLSQESAFGIHIFPTTDLEVLFDFFFSGCCINMVLSLPLCLLLPGRTTF
jgi:hypothetical protein